MIYTKACRYGWMSHYGPGEFVGMAFDLYGEYSEQEVQVFRKLLREGDVAIDGGANIGAFTVPMAQLVGSTGRIHAFEPNPKAYALLCKNIDQNGLFDRVSTHQAALHSANGTLPMESNYDYDLGRAIGISPEDSSRGRIPDGVSAISSSVALLPDGGMAPSSSGRLPVFKEDPEAKNIQPGASAMHSNITPGQMDLVRTQVGAGSTQCAAVTIDSLNLQQCRLIKLDIEGSERQALLGATETIKRCRPALYVEADRQHLTKELVATIVEMGYRLWWHRPPQWNPDNFTGNKRNVFGSLVSLMLVCLPEEKYDEVTGLDEVADIRDDDQMFDREIARYSRYLERTPNDLSSRLMIGHYQNLMQREEEAYALLDENLRRDPDHIPSIAIKGLMALQRGDWSAWPLYELRYKQRNTRLFGGHRTHAQMHWDGKPTNKRLLIWNEQGFGDSIMFARFFKHVLRRAPNAFLEVQAHLYELFQRSGISPNGLYRLGRELPEYDLHCSLPSTPATLLANEDMMRVAGPYLFADKKLTGVWRERAGNCRIGICHTGSPISERPYTRDLSSKFWTSLSEEFGPFLSLQSADGWFYNFMETASAIMALDLVITVDTSVAHLAGALGKETWLLLSYDPDFRWGLKGDSTIWYPSMRIFRQPRFRDWAAVIDEVRAALVKFTQAPAEEAAE